MRFITPKGFTLGCPIGLDSSDVHHALFNCALFWLHPPHNKGDRIDYSTNDTGGSKKRNIGQVLAWVSALIPPLHPICCRALLVFAAIQSLKHASTTCHGRTLWLHFACICTICSTTVLLNLTNHYHHHYITHISYYHYYHIQLVNVRHDLV